MRRRGAALLPVALPALIALLGAPGAGPGVPAAVALPADSVSASVPASVPASTPDSIAASPAAIDSTLAAAVAEAAAAGPERASLALEILDARRDGATSVRRQWQGRRPVAILRLPLVGDALDRPIALDAGTPLEPWRPPSSDRTPVDGFPLYFGAPNAAATLARPATPEGDPFLVDSWGRAPGPRGAFPGPASPVTGAAPEIWWERALLGGSDGAEPTESALAYERGERGLEQTGVRFTAPAFARGIAGAFTRRASDGDGAIVRALETRYVVAAGLPRVGGARTWLEGSIAERRLDEAIPDPILERLEAGVAEGERRHLALHASRPTPSGVLEFEARAASVRHTQVEFDGARERWEEPSWTLRADGSGRAGPAWTWLLAAETTGRTIRSRAGPAVGFSGSVDASFEIHRQEGRLAAGLRRESGDAREPGTLLSWGADLAYDVREGSKGLLDARIFAAARGARAAAAIDLASAHERPTWEDLLLPARDRAFADVVVVPKPVRYRIRSDASLGARRLDGVGARAAWSPGRRVRLHATGSIRHVTDDFGWDLLREETSDSLFLTDRARRRGDGWSSHASLGASFDAAHVAARLLGWARGGDRDLAPRAGSPPWAGLDAALDLKATLFTNFTVPVDPASGDQSLIPFWSTKTHVYCFESRIRIVAFDIESLEKKTLAAFKEP
ncbi:MAG TPA: hypothetical protein VLT84_01470, partial [Acidobacteriota bacterium]|nr:hypothetical protein [Acidobacteriota bacterium]